MTNPDNFVVVGFGAGTLHGLAGNCALARLLEELDLRQHVKQVWGCSAGAVVGGGWSCGTPALRILELIDSLKHRKALDFAGWEVLGKGLFNFLFRGKLPEGLVRGRLFRETILRGLSVERVEDCEIPFRTITCTDDGRARKIVLREGSLIEAILGSMCLPGVFFPIPDSTGETVGYFDGGVVEKTPLLSVIEEHTREGRDSKLLVLCTHFDAEERITRPRGFLARFVSTFSRMEDFVWESQLQRAQAAPNCKFVVLNPKMKYGQMFDFGAVRFNYLWSRKRFKSQLSNAGLAKRFDAS